MALKDVNFPNYEDFTDIDLGYSDFIDNLMNVINNIAPIKQSKVKSNSQDWFDGEIAEKIAIRDKLFKKYKKSRLHIDKDLYKDARNQVQNVIKRKKKTFFENKLKENIAKPKELWKTLKELGLPNKDSTNANICLKDNNGNILFDTNSTVNIFKNFFSNLANSLLSKLPIAPKRFDLSSVATFYQNIILKNRLTFKRVSEEEIYNILN